MLQLYSIIPVSNFPIRTFIKWFQSIHLGGRIARNLGRLGCVTQQKVWSLGLLALKNMWSNVE